MNNNEIIVITDNVKECKIIQSRLDDLEYSFQVIDNQDDIISQVTGLSSIIVLVVFPTRKIEWIRVVEILRKTLYQTPGQILLLSDNMDILDKAMELGVDDFIQNPMSELEFQARIKAAKIRLQNQVKVFQEREFFRRAVRQEEELASRILDQHLHLKEAFRNIESINEELERSNHHLEKIAKYDILSGLLNRMTLFSVIDIELERSIRSSAPLTGIMVDIDHFKNINDNFGHLHGDAVIRELGKRLTKMLRKYDNAGRYGGEEFFILLPDTNKEQAYSIAERFRKDLETRIIEFDGDEIMVTASIGITEYILGEKRERWIGRADRAMYEAKQAGRNKVIVV